MTRDHTNNQTNNNFTTRLTGVTFTNEESKTSRQDLIKGILATHNFEEDVKKLFLQRESDNKFDVYAVSVHTTPDFSSDKNKIGYIPREKNRSLSESLGRGDIIDVYATQAFKAFNADVIGLEVRVSSVAAGDKP